MLFMLLFRYQPFDSDEEVRNYGTPASKSLPLDACQHIQDQERRHKVTEVFATTIKGPVDLRTADAGKLHEKFIETDFRRPSEGIRDPSLERVKSTRNIRAEYFQAKCYRKNNIHGYPEVNDDVAKWARPHRTIGGLLYG
jgi:hypothetical protein